MLSEPSIHLVFQLIHAGVNGIPPQQILLQHTVRPPPKQYTAQGLNTVTDGSDDFKVVNNLRTPFGICLQNMQTILFVHFAFFECVCDMSTDNRPIPLEQNNHLLL